VNKPLHKIENKKRGCPFETASFFMGGNRDFAHQNLNLLPYKTQNGLG
jgi:hypothetical protein